MKIKKIGHCCLLIETKGKRILTDPGTYTLEGHSGLEDLDYILFTHDHPDHYHLESLKVLIEKNPAVQIIANISVSDLLEKEGIGHELMSHGDEKSLGEVSLSAIGEKHEEIYRTIPLADNTGFFIDNRFWYPGDAFTDPKRAVEILALPVTAPWLKLSDSIDYAIALKPKVAFPVHDAVRGSVAHNVPAKVLPENGIEFIAMVEGDEKEF